jgi:uncharacterized protein YodC (DUF2158 family)
MENSYNEITISTTGKVEILSNIVQYYHKGDVVAVKNIPSPKMLVNDIKFKVDSQGNLIKDHLNQKILLGVECYWFTNDNKYQKKIFNTKDLILITL